MRRGSKKCKSFKMCLNLNVYQFKTSIYSYRSIYMNSMVKTNKKPIIDSQKLQRKKHEHTGKENHQSRREETKKKKKRTEKNYKNNQKIGNKVAISTYMSIVTLNDSGLHV